MERRQIGQADEPTGFLWRAINIYRELHSLALPGLEWRADSAHVCAMPGPIATARIESPVGRLILAADADHLVSIKFIGNAAALPFAVIERDAHNNILEEAVGQLERWFSGDLQAFSLPLLPLGTPEGDALRAGIAAIPYGETRTYGALGETIGSVARAVGQACKTNSYPIVIPCHRVTSAAGPEYYSGGEGPRTKTWLLDFEYANLPPEKRSRLI